MTVEERIQEMLEQKGMFESQAKAVIAAAKESDLLKDSGLHWSSDVCDYPETFLVTLWMSVCAIANDWIEENCPKAFFKPMFADA